MLVLASLLALFPVYVMVTAAFKSQGGFLNHPFALLSHPTLAGFRTALNDQFPLW
jgi:ABC-type glycerol-3-phosphate transport system permease component